MTIGVTPLDRLEMAWMDPSSRPSGVESARPRAGMGACYVDAEGREFLDCGAGAGGSLLGRGHPGVEAAVEAGRGVAESGPSAGESRRELSAVVVRSVPGAEQLLMMPSGAEALAAGVAIACRVTGRHRAARIKGALRQGPWHLDAQPTSVRHYLSAVIGSDLEIGFNDLIDARAAFARHADELGVIVVEPMLTGAGAVHQRHEFVQELRTFALERDIPFMLDLTTTLGTFGSAAVSDHLHLTPMPDLTAFGELSAAGMPLGMLTGRADLVGPASDVLAARRIDAGAVAAARATLELTTADIVVRMSGYGSAIRRALTDIAGELSMDIAVTGAGSCCGLHFTDEDVVDADSAARADHRLWRIMQLGLADSGVWLGGRTFGPTAAHTLADIDRLIARMGDVLVVLDDAHLRSRRSDGRPSRDRAPHTTPTEGNP